MAKEIARKLRKSATRQERILWLRLRELKQLGFHFRRQVPVKGYIVDFACYHPRIVVEIDGSQHAATRHGSKDAARDAELAADGFRIVRVWNNDVDTNLAGVFERILFELGAEIDPPPGALCERADLPTRGRFGVCGTAPA